MLAAAAAAQQACLRQLRRRNRRGCGSCDGLRQSRPHCMHARAPATHRLCKPSRPAEQGGWLQRDVRVSACTRRPACPAHLPPPARCPPGTHLALRYVGTNGGSGIGVPKRTGSLKGAAGAGEVRAVHALCLACRVAGQLQRHGAQGEACKHRRGAVSVPALRPGRIGSCPVLAAAGARAHKRARAANSQAALRNHRLSGARFRSRPGTRQAHHMAPCKAAPAVAAATSLAATFGTKAHPLANSWQVPACPAAHVCGDRAFTCAMSTTNHTGGACQEQSGGPSLPRWLRPLHIARS